MIGKLIKFNRRNAMSFVLAVIMLTLVTTPALAWFDEGDVNSQAARPCRVISGSNGAHTVYCFQVVPRHPHPVAKQPLLRPAIARAEQGHFFNQGARENLVRAAANQ